MSESTSAALDPVDTQYGDDINVRAIVVWGLVSVVITFITIAALHWGYNAMAAEQRVEKTYEGEYGKYASADSMLDQQNAQLQQPVRYLDQQGQTVGVPINRAMEMTLKEFGSQQ